ncbi:hypothetical protein BAUCODRAFT_57261, partial [Baudoinia panamericana UAMH 10762]
LHILQSELTRRQTEGERPACGSGTNTHGYNTPFHVFALFLILLISTLACSFPVIVRRFPKLPVPNYALFLSRHFGTGVLIATAFVHLLPTAYVSLTDPCLPRFWNEVYPAMSGFIAMCSVFAVVGVEMVFALKGARHSHGGLDLEGLKGEGRKAEHRRGDSVKRFKQGPIGLEPLPPQPQFDDEPEDLDLDELDPVAEDQQPLTATGRRKEPPSANGHLARPDGQSRSTSFANPNTTTNTVATDQRAILQCLLLEAGILFHSVFIGMALSVSTGPAFLVLLIAICFHQTFEGLALGSRIAAIPSFSTTSLKPWLMSAMYGVTTPIGQAIGLAVHTLYDPASQFGLLTVGSVNAVSAGLLLYAGLVQLLAEDFLSEGSYTELHGRRRLEACGAVVCGSMLMAFVG